MNGRPTNDFNTWWIQSGWYFRREWGIYCAGEDLPAFNPDVDGSKPRKALSPIDLAKEFEILRAKSITILSKVQAKDLSRKAKHQELGIVSLGEMINEWAGHDAYCPG